MNWKFELLIKSGILVHEWQTEPIWLIKRDVKIYLLLFVKHFIHFGLHSGALG